MPAIAYHSRSIPELIAKRAREQPDDPAVYTGVPTDEPSKFLQSLSYRNLERAIDRLAWHYSAIPGLMPTKPTDGSAPPVRIVSVITSSAIDETLLEIAFTKLGLTALLLSVNNSVSAIAHLTKLTGARHIVFGAKFVAEAKEAKQLLKEKDGYDVELLEDKRFPIWGEGGVETVDVKPFQPVLMPEQERSRPAVVLHSSGSTGFPKPVYVSHTGLIANAALNQNKNGFSTLPVFHGYGHFALFRCFYAGRRITLFPPHLPLTSANICRVIQASPDVRQCYAVPYVIKLLGETDEGTRALADFDLVSYAGAALPDDLGDRLTKQGVNILAIYGTTETGTLMNSNRDFENDKNWNWLRIVDTNYIVLEPKGGDSFEVVVKDGYPPKIETNRPDGSYATKDLVIEHKTRPGLYKCVGRLDDTLVQTLGEKTNPVPIELAIRGNSPYVAEAIVFGAGRPQTGVLILPSDLAHAEGLDQDEKKMFQAVWSVIEGANAEAPSHSRLLPEMVAFLPYGTQIPVATKMSILRPACYAKFKDIIDGIYDRFESASDVEKVSPPLPELEDFVQQIIREVVGPIKGAQLTKDVDLFTFGVDSLQCARVRNTITKKVELNGGQLGQNVVYEYPSVQQLAKHIIDVQGGTGAGDSIEAPREQMLEYVEKFAAGLVDHKPTKGARPDASHVVILTGASGSLGAHILAHLTASPNVRQVICLTRAKTHEESSARAKESIKLRKLSLTPEQEAKVVSLASNANDDLLGLKKEEYDALVQEATVIIHNAWPVNFNLSLPSFAPHIQGTVNLMNLALSSPYASPAQFFFSSSISCRQGAQGVSEVPEEYSPDPSTAVGTGYARSKWVVEKLSERAADKKGLPVGVLRIGQMVGDTVNGVWNETEAWPLMFKGANTVGYLPVSSTDVVAWLPVDHAGQAIAEVVLRPSPPQSIVYHIVTPQLSPWNDILAGLRDAGVKFEGVEPAEYIKKLNESEKDPEKNPVIKLLPFFTARYSGPAKKPVVFRTDETAKVADGIKTSPPLTKELVRKWVEHWREVGFLTQA